MFIFLETPSVLHFLPFQKGRNQDTLNLPFIVSLLNQKDMLSTFSRDFEAVHIDSDAPIQWPGRDGQQSAQIASLVVSVKVKGLASIGRRSHAQ